MRSVDKTSEIPADEKRKLKPPPAKATAVAIAKVPTPITEPTIKSRSHLA